MAGTLRLSNTGTGNGQSTITTAAAGDTTYTLPSGGGTFVTTASTEALTVPFASGTAGSPSVTFIGDTDTGIYSPGANQVAIATSGNASLYVASDGKVGIGTTSVNAPLHVSNGGAAGLEFYPDSYEIQAYNRSTSAYGLARYNAAGHQFAVSATEAARIDSSGRLLVGTSSAPTGGNQAQFSRIHCYGNTFDNAAAGFINIGRNETASAMSSGDGVGAVVFSDSAGGEFASIFSYVDATPGTSDYPGRLVFSTTADAASSPTERMRITSGGRATFTGASNLVLNIDSGTIISEDLYNTWTTVSAANLNIGGDYIFRRSTSSIKYKIDVETLQDEYADALLACRPVWYRSKCDGDNPSWGYWGFIAEEVAEVDPRLVFWKTHETVADENGNEATVELDEPVAEGVQYDRFVPHLLNLIKRQGEAIAELQAEVAALKSA